GYSEEGSSNRFKKQLDLAHFHGILLPSNLSSDHDSTISCNRQTRNNSEFVLIRRAEVDFCSFSKDSYLFSTQAQER
ncbi:MAG: hypothetical protein M1587_10535, partial [Thaumarchaeota archaeon]|nr:hypothetical protein [Nitrososphaerota archaeon]